MKKITIASAKGGVGKSSVCCGVGKLLASQGKRVLLIDMDIGVRSLDILLGISEKTLYNWGDIIKENCDYRKAVSECGKELYLLPAPVDFCSEYTVDSFINMVKSFESQFDYIFFDAPAGLETGFNLAVSCADMCVVVTTPDAVSVRAASYAAQNIKKQDVKDVRLIVNRFNKKLHKTVDVDSYIDNVCARLVGIIPESEDIYNFVNGKKIPEDSKGNQAFFRIAQRLEGKNIPFRAKNI